VRRHRPIDDHRARYRPSRLDRGCRRRPHGADVPFEANFWRSVGWQGGVAPARAYIPELLDDVLSGVINPGRVFDYETSLDEIVDAYAAMDERRAIKSLVRVGSI